MKERCIFVALFLGMYCLFVSPGSLEAITVSATPAQAVVNQAVIIRSNASYLYPPYTNCPFQINFGDGSPWTSLGSCGTRQCLLTASHSYANSGTYTVSVRQVPGACPNLVPQPPSIGSTSVQVQDLSGTIQVSPASFNVMRGVSTSQRLGYVLSSTPAINLTLQSARGIYLVNGNQVASLNTPMTAMLSNGKARIQESINLSGTFLETIAQRGVTSFQYQRTFSSQSLTLRAEAVIRITQPTVSINGTPGLVEVARGNISTKRFDYTCRITPALDTTLSSAQGVFQANGYNIGTVKSPLSVSVRSGLGSVSESITIPLAVIQRAEEQGTTRILYVRNFSNQFLSSTVHVEIVATTEAGGPFQISRIELFFENQRPEITINRNQLPPKLFAEIRYTGSGLLRAYWEVDGRLLSWVNKHLVYGRQAVFEFPEIPPLPTFESGSHIVRFVIEEPSEDIFFPKAVYYVTGEADQSLRDLKLRTPEDGKRLPYDSPAFSWKSEPELPVYLVEFSRPDQIEPFFAAYTKKPHYRVPQLVLENRFQKNSLYTWQVKGFDAKSVLAAQSEHRDFIFRRD